MDRRQFITASLFAVGSIGPSRADLNATALKPSPISDEQVLRARLADWYREFGKSNVDMARYLDFTTEDYLLVEKGALLDRAADAAMMSKNEPGMVRTDSFDFRRIHIDGDRADLVYYLTSVIKDSKGTNTHRWIETAVAVRQRGVWRFSLLHSSRVPDAAKG